MAAIPRYLYAGLHQVLSGFPGTVQSRLFNRGERNEQFYGFANLVSLSTLQAQIWQLHCCSQFRDVLRRHTTLMQYASEYSKIRFMLGW